MRRIARSAGCEDDALVQVIGVAIDGDAVTMVRALDPGTSLGRLLSVGSPAVGHVAALAEGMLTALGALHMCGLVHGAIHPGNVLLDDDGSVRLCDAGLEPEAYPRTQRRADLEAVTSLLLKVWHPSRRVSNPALAALLEGDGLVEANDPTSAIEALHEVWPESERGPGRAGRASGASDRRRRSTFPATVGSPSGGDPWVAADPGHARRRWRASPNCGHTAAASPTPGQVTRPSRSGGYRGCGRGGHVTRAPDPSRSRCCPTRRSGTHHPCVPNTHFTKACETVHREVTAGGLSSRTSCPAFTWIPRKRRLDTVARKLWPWKHLHPHVSHRPGPSRARHHRLAGCCGRPVLRRRNGACERVGRRRGDLSVHVAKRHRHLPSAAPMALYVVSVSPVRVASPAVDLPLGPSECAGTGT